jgi:hypothetical protein
MRNALNHIPKRAEITILVDPCPGDSENALVEWDGDRITVYRLALQQFAEPVKEQ